jgi:hypothetical protein
MIFERPILDIPVLERSSIGGRSICSTLLSQASLCPSVPFNEVCNKCNPLQLLTPSLYHVGRYVQDISYSYFNKCYELLFYLKKKKN